MDRIELKKVIVFVVAVMVISGMALGADEAPVRRGRPGPGLGRGMAADPNNVTPGEPLRRRGLGRNRSADQPAVPNAPDETNVPGRGYGFGRGRARRQDPVEQQQWHRGQGRRGIGAEGLGRGLNRQRNIPDERGQGVRMGRGNRPGRGWAQQQDSTEWQNWQPGEGRRGPGQRGLERGLDRRQRFNAERGRGPIGSRSDRDDYGERPGLQRGRRRGLGAGEDAEFAPGRIGRQRRGRWQNPQRTEEFQEDTQKERLPQQMRVLRRFGERLRQRMRYWR